MKTKQILATVFAAIPLYPVGAIGHPGHSTSPGGMTAHVIGHILPALLLLGAVGLGYMIIRRLNANRRLVKR